MSKKYVPSFLQSDALPTFEPFQAFQTAKKVQTAFPDAFSMNKKKQVEGGSFPMNKPSRSDAFESTSSFPDNDAFQKKKKRDDSDYSAFSKPKQTESISRAFTSSLPPKPPGPATMASLTALSLPTGPASSEQDQSFAAKFAARMKIVEDPDYVPPPKIVNVSSEEDFPTLGPTRTLSGSSVQSGWGQTSFIEHAEEWSTQLKQEQEQQRALQEQKEQEALAKKQPTTEKKTKKIPRLPKQKLVSSETEPQEEFKPIDYDEDAFEDNSDLDVSDLDEETLFHDSEHDEDEDEDGITLEERRHREELY